MKKLSKKDAEKEIKQFFKNLKNKTPREVKKIKRLAMKYNIKLKELRKLFCKKCYSIFNAKNSEIRIKKGIKIVKCKKCGCVNRWKMK